MSRLQRGIRSPLYHFEAYGIQNPMVQWLVEKGHYDPGACQECRGSGKLRGRYGEKLYELVDGERRELVCPFCRGRGRKADRSVHETDFGDPESRELALRAFPGLYVEPHAAICASRRRDASGHAGRCDCILH